MSGGGYSQNPEGMKAGMSSMSEEHNPTNMKRSAEELIKRYFIQLTEGCGRADCSNEHCATGSKKQLPKNEAAATALQLLLIKARLCEARLEIQHPSVNVVNVEVAPDPELSKQYLQTMIDHCQEVGDFKPLVRYLGKVFSSPEILNKSFRSDDIKENTPESVLPVNHVDVIECYNMLFRLEHAAVENSIINGINALGNSIEIELKTNQKALEMDYLHQFVIVMLNPNLHSPEYLESALPNILRALTALSLPLQATLVTYWSKYTEDELRKVLDIFQQMITVRILTGPHAVTSLPVNDDHPITNSVKCMEMVYYASILGGSMDEELKFKAECPMETDPPSTASLISPAMDIPEREIPKNELATALNLDVTKSRQPLIAPQDFVNECLNDALEMDRDFMNYKEQGIKFTFLKYPFVLSTATKSLGLCYDNRVRMYSERRMTILYSLMQGDNVSPFLKLRVRRGHLIEDALVRLEMVAQDRPGDFKKQFYVEFEGEQGIDEGGVSKEFFQLVIDELFNPDFGMFEFNEQTRLCWFNPNSFETENQFTLIGLLFGIAIYNSVILDVHFPPVIYRKLLGKPGTFNDLQTTHGEIYRSLRYLLDYTGNVAEDIMTTFEISYKDVFGSTISHELIEDGKNIPVTNENRNEYVERYTDFLLNQSTKRQFEAFKSGFDIVTHDSILKNLFRADELELLVCGSKHFNLHELEEATEYDGGYTSDSPVIGYFWQVVHSMSNEEQRQLLNFTTGSDRVPVGGLAKLKMIIAKNGPDSDRLPTAHTCFNVLLLPEYSSLEKTRDRLLKAISYAKGFGLM